MPRLQGQQLGPEAAASGLLHIAVQPAHAPTEEAAKRARSLLAGMQVLHSSDSFLCCICRVPAKVAHALQFCAAATYLHALTAILLPQHDARVCIGLHTLELQHVSALVEPMKKAYADVSMLGRAHAAYSGAVHRCSTCRAAWSRAGWGSRPGRWAKSPATYTSRRQKAARAQTWGCASSTARGPVRAGVRPRTGG